MKLLSTVISMLVCLGAAFPAERQSPGYAAYERANAFFIVQKYPESRSAIDEALRLDAKLFPALTLKAKLAMAMNRFNVARESLDLAVKAEPGSGYAQFLYGMAYFLTNDLQLAEPHFDAARRLDKRDARAVLYLGLTRESLGKPTEALSLYEESVGIKAQPESLLAGARQLLLMGRLEEAEHWTTRALTLDPKSRDSHFELARLLLKRGDPKAAQEGEIALGLSGGTVSDSQIHYLLIGAYRVSNPSKSAAHAEALRAIEPN